MGDYILAKKIKDKISKDEKRLLKSIEEVKRIWEETGLDPKDSSYLVEKTMRFEMAQFTVNAVFALFNEIISDYKNLCSELEKES